MPFTPRDLIPSPYIRGIGTFSCVNSTTCSDRYRHTYLLLGGMLTLSFTARAHGMTLPPPPGTLSFFERGKEEAQSTEQLVSSYSATGTVPSHAIALVKPSEQWLRKVWLSGTRCKVGFPGAAADPKDMPWLVVCTVAPPYPEFIVLGFHLPEIKNGPEVMLNGKLQK